MTYTLTAKFEISVQEITDLIETAGYGMNYWCEFGKYDDEAQTYEVRLDAEAQDGVDWETDTKVITYQEIVDAIQKLISGEVSVGNWIRESLVAEFISKDGGSMDSDGAEVVIQVALFGEIIFG